MRKFSLLLLALFVVSGTAFAQVVVEPTVEAEGTATFGVDLDEGVSGIKTGLESTISFDFTEEQSAEFGEGDVYGYIMVENFSVGFESSGNDEDDEGALDVAVGDVTAKVMLGPAYIELASNYDEVDQASDFSLIGGDIIAPFGNVSNVHYTGATAPAGESKTTAIEYAGVTVGADLPGLMSVGFSVASQYDWAQSGAKTTNADVWPNMTYELWSDFFDFGGGAAQVDQDGNGTTGDKADFAAWQAKSVKAATGDRNLMNAYMLGLEVEVTAIEAVSVTLVSNMSFGVATGQTDKDGDELKATPGSHNNPAAIGLGVAYDMPMGDMTLTPEFGVDVTFEKAAAPPSQAAATTANTNAGLADVFVGDLTKLDGSAQEDSPLGVDFEVGLGANLTWGDLGIVEDDADYFGLEDQETTSGIGFGVTYSNLGAVAAVPGSYTNANTGATVGYSQQIVTDSGEYEYYRQNWIFTKVGLYEDSGDDGLLPVLGAAVVANYNMFLGAELSGVKVSGTSYDITYAPYQQLGIGVEVDADLGVISPYAGLITGSTQTARKVDEYDDGVSAAANTEVVSKKADWGLTVNLGTDINVISNTTFTVDWKSGNLGNTGKAGQTADYVYDENDYTIAAGLNAPATDGGSRLGVVTLKTAIEF